MHLRPNVGSSTHNCGCMVNGSGAMAAIRVSPGERNGKFSKNGKFGQNGKFSQNGKFGQNGKFSQNGELSQNGKFGQRGKVHLRPNVGSSTHNCGCMVNGSGAMAAI